MYCGRPRDQPGLFGTCRALSLALSSSPKRSPVTKRNYFSCGVLPFTHSLYCSLSPAALGSFLNVRQHLVHLRLARPRAGYIECENAFYTDNTATASFCQGYTICRFLGSPRLSSSPLLASPSLLSERKKSMRGVNPNRGPC